MGGISIWSLLLIFAIIVLLFGTKKLRGLGGDLGSAFKGFKEAIDDKKGDADFTAPDAKVDQQLDKQEGAKKTSAASQDDSTKS